jgi:hypothetical protein
MAHKPAHLLWIWHANVLTSSDMAHEPAQGTEKQAVALRGQEGKKEKHTYSLLPPCPEARQSGKHTVRKTWGKNLRDLQIILKTLREFSFISVRESFLRWDFTLSITYFVF